MSTPEAQPKPSNDEFYKEPRVFVDESMTKTELCRSVNRHLDNLYHAINTILGSLDCVGLPSDPKKDNKESTLFALGGPDAGNWIRKNWKTGEEFVDGPCFNQAELKQFNRIADREFARLRNRSAAQVQAEERKEFIKQWAGDQRPIIVGQVWQSMSGRLIHIDRATALGIAYHETAFWGRTAQKQATIEEFRTRIKNEGLTLVTEAPQINAIIDGPSLTQERAMELIDQLYQQYPMLRPAPPQARELPTERIEQLKLIIRLGHILGDSNIVFDSNIDAAVQINIDEVPELKAFEDELRKRTVRDGS